MNLSHSIWLGFFSTLALTGLRVSVLISPALVVALPAAASLSGSDVNAIAREITVRIDGENTGSGIIIERQGSTYFVLTNWHIINQAGNYTLATSDGRKHALNSSLFRRLPQVDLAVLQFTSAANYPVAKLGISQAVTEGSRIYVAGWADPGPTIPERTYQFLTGYVSGRLQSSDEGYSLIYTVNAIPGMSGGPVLNDRGDVIGVNGRAIPDLRTGTINFVLGIGIDTYSFQTPGRNRAVTEAETPASEFFSRAMNKASQGDYQAAIADYNRTIELNPNFAYAYANRGIARYQQGDLAGAIADYNRAIELNPSFAYAYNNRGLTRYQQGDLAGAIADYNRAIELDPNFAYAYANRGIAYRHLGNPQEAIANLEKSATLFLQQGDTKNSQGVLQILREL